ncbi:transposase [Draconibacterium orientale]|uniref:Transposase n=3 Tax=Draconibacterium orientale TaxID=1168034 RepID=A0ABM5QBY4_9BACT|nr:IS4 family transposase [Draconibacterium orientale]AHW61330.1 transposase [Draconibacterium orientale]
MTGKQSKISITELLSLLPDEELNKIARRTKVNYYVKVLDGKSIFCLILYALVECQRNSLRTMEDIFNSAQFKFLFNLDTTQTIRHSSISERLSVINIEFFQQAYELTYNYFSTYYSRLQREQVRLIRVDSSMVAEAANKLIEGMNVGCKKDGKKQIKFTVAFDGDLPCMTKIFTNRKCLSEDTTIPQVVFDYARKDKSAIFTFDRGVGKRETFCRLSQQGTSFVTRINPKAKYKLVRELENGNNRLVGSLELIKELEVQLPKNRKEHWVFPEETFRLTITRHPEDGTEYWFLTNLFEIGVEEVLQYYKKRWDIEVFFRFLKQELNFSHITSTNPNGIAVMMYMTMITAMMVLIYKKLNNIGYKTAVRRISLELNELIIKMIVKHCGGDPSLVFR